MLTFEVGDDCITLRRRSHYWTAQLFLNAFGERYAGWWAGIRPVLAAFAWTEQDHLAYRSSDANDIGRLLGAS